MVGGGADQCDDLGSVSMSAGIRASRHTPPSRRDPALARIDTPVRVRDDCGGMLNR
jgi:hypothetical protein